MLLRKKKFQESQLEKMDGQLDNIERMVIMIETHFENNSFLTLYLIETPFNTFASRADSDQAGLVFLIISISG